MKIAMVVGSYPPDICGVGDYTYCLVKALKIYECDIEVITNYKWSIKEFKIIEKKLKGFDIVHIQYPSIGYGYSLLPQIFSGMPNVILTLHEISQAKILRKISLIPFFCQAKNIIYTNDFERNYVSKLNDLFNINTFVIPIGSNIPFMNIEKKDKKKIVSFGLIRKNKGLENVIALAQEIERRKLPYIIQIIGQVEKKQIEYFNEVKNKDACIEWKIGCNENDVAQLLAEAMFGYLPFPDGASERRGSLIALLLNKVIVITQKGKFTTCEMEKSMLFADSIEGVLQCIKEVEENLELKKNIIKNANEYIKKFSWGSIADRHFKVYKQIYYRKGYI